MREDLLSEKCVSLKPSGIRKFFDVVADMKDAISLGVGEPDFDTPWHIRDEGIYSLEKGRTFYTSNAGLKELRMEIAAYLKRTQGVDYHYLHQILVTVGGSEGIDLAMRALINPGDEVLIPQPSYVSYEPCTVLADGAPVTINLKEENRFRLTPEELEAAITPKSKLLVLPYPNNPIYGELTYTGNPHVSIASIPGMQERTILINGFSKAYAMTGWRLGYVAGPERIVKQMTKSHQYCIMCAPTTSQYAAVDALRNGDEDVKRMRESYDERRRYVLHALHEMGIPCFEPEGAFYVFPCIRQFGMTSEEFSVRLLQEEKVAIVPGTAFGDCGEGYLRISYAYSIDDLKKALGRLRKFVQRLQAENAGNTAEEY